jgi:hypothetical protein
LIALNSFCESRVAKPLEERPVPPVYKQILKAQKKRQERDLNVKVWTLPREKSNVKQSEVIDSVLQKYKDTPTLDASLFILKGRGVCMSYCAFYLINRLADNGTFWSWLDDPLSKWAVISQYLSDDFRILAPGAMQSRLQNDFLKKRLNHFETEILKNQYYNLPTLAAYCGTRYARAQGVMCILSTDPKSPAHAVAVTRQGGKIRFMDPEIGEWMFVTENEFDWWMEKQGDRYTRFSHAHLNYYSVR